jgi:GNAT superfamily N-acetyltransferase
MKETCLLVQRASVSLVADSDDYGRAKTLIAEYYAWALTEVGLDDLREAAPEIADELDRLDRHYRPPDAHLLLARLPQYVDPIGVCAVERLDDSAAELKRLYVRPAARRRGVARQLAGRVAELAREMGCRRLHLDTNWLFMQPAVALYRDLGFVPSARCTDIDTPGMVGFRLDLESE